MRMSNARKSQERDPGPNPDGSRPDNKRSETKRHCGPRQKGQIANQSPTNLNKEDHGNGPEPLGLDQCTASHTKIYHSSAKFPLNYSQLF